MKITSAAIEQLAPIIEQIDHELAKDQEDRVSFQLYSNRVPSLKTSLATYKSLFKRDEWNGKFWMHKKTNKETKEQYLEIDFTPKSRMNFTMKPVEVPKDTDAAFHIVTPNDAPNPGDGPAFEMNDRQISQMLLLENPKSAQFLISALSDETKAFLADMKNADPTGLINLIQRNGYKISVVMDTRLRIYK